ncbi:helix-turn-helix transcriptional regulator [Enterococcus raffinosus]|uniref:helix-turn-helix domain-containing protein n=1 Tax=Enterococcus raffinosus TaxID=71452 RepID=UPI0028FD2536|nr:helix-turn-helix transcriptional regulator [Enterococcus raffinosus]
MSLLYRIKDLASQRKVSLAEVEREAGLSSGSITKWDKSSPKAESLQKVADYFDVSTDYLLGRTEKKKYYELSDKEKKDIAIQADELIEGIANGENLNFYGEPATKDQKDRLLIAIRTAMEMNKEEAKQKFTRKDYRD